MLVEKATLLVGSGLLVSIIEKDPRTSFVLIDRLFHLVDKKKESRKVR